MVRLCLAKVSLQTIELAHTCRILSPGWWCGLSHGEPLLIDGHSLFAVFSQRKSIVFVCGKREGAHWVGIFVQFEIRGLIVLLLRAGMLGGGGVTDSCYALSISLSPTHTLSQTSLLASPFGLLVRAPKDCPPDTELSGRRFLHPQARCSSAPSFHAPCGTPSSREKWPFFPPLALRFLLPGMVFTGAVAIDERGRHPS